MKNRSKPKFSIIVPVHNEIGLIRPFVLHMYDQDFSNEEFEIIFVDNASTDMTKEEIKKVTREFPSLKIRYKEELQRHVSAARNTGGVGAHGEYLVFLDADNSFDSHLLSELDKAISQGYEAGTFFSLPNKFSYRGMLIFVLLEMIKLVVFWKPFGKNFCRKDLFKKVGGYRPDINIGTNLDFMTRIRRYVVANKIGAIAHIHRPIYVSLRRFEQKGYIDTLWRWFMGYVGLRNIGYNQSYKENMIPKIGGF
jgi:glycosyltransferase involved in cell wall biosynthesis